MFLHLLITKSNQPIHYTTNNQLETTEKAKILYFLDKQKGTLDKRKFLLVGYKFDFKQ